MSARSASEVRCEGCLSCRVCREQCGHPQRSAHGICLRRRRRPILRSVGRPPDYDYDYEYDCDSHTTSAATIVSASVRGVSERGCHERKFARGRCKQGSAPSDSIAADHGQAREATETSVGPCAEGSGPCHRYGRRSRCAGYSQCDGYRPCAGHSRCGGDCLDDRRGRCGGAVLRDQRRATVELLGSQPRRQVEQSRRWRRHQLDQRARGRGRWHREHKPADRAGDVAVCSDQRCAGLGR